MLSSVDRNDRTDTNWPVNERRSSLATGAARSSPSRGATNREGRGADDDRVTNGDIELRQQFRPYQRASILQQGVRKGGPALEGQRAVQRIPRLHAPEFHQPGTRLRRAAR